MGMDLWRWRLTHLDEWLIGRAYSRYGAGARIRAPWWRYPITWAYYRYWRWTVKS